MQIFYVDYLCESINAMFKSSMFSDSLKLVDITQKRQERVKSKL